MSIISFLKEAGEKLFNHTSTEPTAEAASPDHASTPVPDTAGLDAKAADAIKTYIASQNLPTKALTVTFEGATRTVTVAGEVADQATREKIVLCCGNVAGVEEVEDLLTTADGAAGESTYHEVKAGETLSKIAQEAYGDAHAYLKIFEANKPMLSNPDKIYPGQKLRIPAAE